MLALRRQREELAPNQTATVESALATIATETKKRSSIPRLRRKPSPRVQGAVRELVELAAAINDEA
jgi:hypothetical protein